MSDKEEKLKKLLERLGESERHKELDESRERLKQEIFDRQITRMQSPDKWPDPPEENENSGNK